MLIDRRYRRLADFHLTVVGEYYRDTAVAPGSDAVTLVEIGAHGRDDGVPPALDPDLTCKRSDSGNWCLRRRIS